MAPDVAAWLDFLCNACKLAAFEDRRDPVLLATEGHWATFYRRCQYGTDDQVISPDSWRTRFSAVKRLYEYMRARYNHVPPFDIISFTTAEGFCGTALAKYKPRRRNTGSAGIPITPHFMEHLLMGAM